VLDLTLRALADPTRQVILVRLARGDASVGGELAQPFGVALPTISRHLRVLEHARLIEKRKDGSRRHCRLRIEPSSGFAAKSRGLRNSCFRRRPTRGDALVGSVQKHGRWSDAKLMRELVGRGWHAISDGMGRGFT